MARQKGKELHVYTETEWTGGKQTSHDLTNTLGQAWGQAYQKYLPLRTLQSPSKENTRKQYSVIRLPGIMINDIEKAISVWQMKGRRSAFVF